MGATDPKATVTVFESGRSWRNQNREKRPFGKRSSSFRLIISQL
jgi:hypothetical protein